MLTIGSLFSGIGGLELGLEWSGLGRTVWQVEKDEFCRRVLAKHWPGVAQFDDVRTVGGAQLPRPSLICGGFPCQDVSSAGGRKGLAGSRSGLWFEYLRIVGELAPEWVVVENVASGASLWVDTVRSGLEQLGYETLPVPLSASDVGAPHRRARVFIVAHANQYSKHASTKHAEVAESSAAADADGDLVRLKQGRSSWPDRSREEEPVWAGGSFAEPDMVRVLHGVSRGLDTARRRALGNCVVPQCAEVIGWMIREIIECSNKSATPSGPSPTTCSPT